MKRSGFQRPAYARPPANPGRITRRCHAGPAETRKASKAAPVRSEAYRRLVAALPCCLCGRQGNSQAAHPNTGKGLGLKADDRLCFALCADSPGRVGCHTRFDQGAEFTKELRRMAEQRWALATSQRILADGDWPAGLPLLQDTEVPA